MRFRPLFVLPLQISRGIASQKEGIEMANKSLYVGNLPYNTKEEDLRSIFDPYGPVAEVRIIGDKGFAFVELAEEKMAEAIEAANGKDFGGRTLTVNEARPRTERTGGGGRSGGGGYGGGGGRSSSGGGYGGGGGGGRRW
jgi:RNA recognition motif-containing protein